MLAVLGNCEQTKSLSLICALAGVHRRKAPSLTPRRCTTATLQSPIFCPQFILQLHCWKNQLEFSLDIRFRGDGAAAGSPFSIWYHAANSLPYIIYPWTIPMPTS